MHNSTSSKAGLQNVGTSRGVRVAAMLLLPMLIALVACDSNGLNPGSTPTPAARQPYDGVPEGKPPGLGAPVPDPKEVTETKAAGQLPEFLSKVVPALRDKVTAQYQGAVDHYDEYAHIPCYCGCAIYTTAHMSLAECFIKEKKDNGEVVFTDHSTSCDACQGAAQTTIEGLAQNKPFEDIRADVFKKYSYTGIWTDTPPAP